MPVTQRVLDKETVWTMLEEACSDSVFKYRKKHSWEFANSFDYSFILDFDIEYRKTSLLFQPCLLVIHQNLSKAFFDLQVSVNPKSEKYLIRSPKNYLASFRYGERVPGGELFSLEELSEIIEINKNLFSNDCTESFSQISSPKELLLFLESNELLMGPAGRLIRMFLLSYSLTKDKFQQEFSSDLRTSFEKNVYARLYSSPQADL